MRSRWLLLLLTVFFLGCGDSVPENAAWRGDPEVSGTVLLDEEPLKNASVSFHNSQDDLLQTVTDSAGRYTLDLTSQGSAAIGKYAVRIHASPSSAGSELTDVDRIPARYNEATELVVDIVDGQNTIDFRLESEEEDSD